MSTPQEQAILASINPSGTLQTSLSIYLPVLGGALLVFEALRRRFRQAYDSRRFSATGAWTPPASDGLFAWVPAVWRASDDEIFARCGLDTLCYLRVLRLGRRVALLVVVLSAALFPLYATATPPPTVTVGQKVDPLERITMSNLATGDWRLWAATVASYVVTLFTLSLLLHEYRHYVARRHELLAKRDAPMYTVLMNDLPLKLRTRQTLEQYMRKVFPDAVHSVYVTLDCARLEELVEEREKMRDALEHALAVGEKKGGGLAAGRPTHRDGGSYAGMLCCQRGSCGTRVDSIDFYQERLVKLNGLVAREIRSLEDAQAQLARQVEQQEHGDVKPPPTMTPEEEQQLIARVEAQNEAELQREHEEEEAEKEQAADQQRRSSHQRTRTASSSHPSSTRRSLSAPPAHRPSYHTAINIGSRHDHDEDDYFEEEDDNDQDFDDQDGDGDNDEDEATSLASGDQEAEMDARERRRRLKPIRVMQRSAFVSFKSLMAAQVAQQALQSSNPVAMATTPAPYVDDIHWSNIGRHYHTRAMGRLVASALTVLIVIFWTIPTAFVTSLATVESLRKELPFLNKAFDKHPALEDLFKQLAPLLLVILVALAPVVFRLLSSREGYASNTELNASVFTKLAFFQLVQIFFVTVIVGTVIDSLKVIIDQPKVLINMLGRSMPQQSTFFMSFILVRTGLSLMLELLRVGPLVLALIFKIMSPQLTRRERNGSWLGMTAISNTDPFEPTTQLADAFLALLVTLTFATIAPLVCYFTGFFFLVAELVYRRQVMFVYRSSTHSMGAYWPRLYRFLITALVVSQLTLLGLLSLKKAPGASAAVLVLLIVILLFHHYVSQLYPRAAKYLPLTQCVRIDAQRRHRDKPLHAGSSDDLHGSGAFEFLDHVYRQPAMSQAPPLRVDYQMLEDEFGPEGGIVSSPEMHEEDQRLFAPRGPL